MVIVNVPIICRRFSGIFGTLSFLVLEHFSVLLSIAFLYAFNGFLVIYRVLASLLSRRGPVRIGKVYCNP